MKRGGIELLAPAGGWDSLKAAIIGGADAVYIGLKEFSARAKATNFVLEELPDVIKYAHLFGAKVYIALNTLIKTDEIQRAAELIGEIDKMKADAVIIQDLGLMQRIVDRTCLPIHSSTQLGIHNVYGAIAAKKLGFDRVILSRETTLDDIRRIRDKVDIETEFFVQGALCVAFSGNCLFSSLVSGYSGNRGKCMQLCRKKYTLEIDGEKKSGYYLSAKDLCLLNNLSELIESGITSFKIEGRMRRPEYVGESVAVYRQALDSLKNGVKTDSSESIERLKRVYNRGDYCSAYLSNPTEKIIYPSVQGHKGVKIGTIQKIIGKTAILKTSGKLHIGDGLKFIGKRGESGGCAVSNPDKIVFQGRVLCGDDVHLTTDAAQIAEISARRRTIDISLSVELKRHQHAKVSASTDNVKITHVSDFKVDDAKSAPIMKSDVNAIFTSGIPFYFTVNNIDITVDEGVFVTIGQLKKLRREVIDKISNAIIDSHTPLQTDEIKLKPHIMSDIIHKNTVYDAKKILRCDTESTFYAFNDDNFIDAFIYAPKDFSDVAAIEKIFEESKKTIFLDLPIMAREIDLPILEKLAECDWLENVVANNIYAIELFSNKNILIGESMNFLNDTIEINKISSLESEKFMPSDCAIAFSHLPIMTFAHCPKKSIGKTCSSDCKGFCGTLTDERGNAFKLAHYKVSHCYARLLNSKPLYLCDELAKLGHERVIYDFCGFDTEFAERVMSDIKNNIGYRDEHTHFNYRKVLY